MEAIKLGEWAITGQWHSDRGSVDTTQYRGYSTGMDLKSTGVFVIATLLVASVPSSGIPLKLQGTSPGAFVGEGINALAVALLQDSQQSPAANVAFSPLGHAAVLAALAEGAGGATQGELLAALRLPRDAPLGRAAYRAVLSRLQEKKKVNKPEFRSWFYVYKTAVEIERNYADLLRDNYLMEVHDIDAPENELPSELADKRKPGVQQGSSSIDELPEIPFEKPTSTENPTQPELQPAAAPTKVLAEKPLKTVETKPEAPVQQEPSLVETSKPSVEESVRQEMNQPVDAVEEQINTQTVSPADIVVPATDLLPPLEDPVPPAAHPDKQVLPGQQSEQQPEPVNQISTDKDTVKSEVSIPEEKPLAEEQPLQAVPSEKETVKTEENKSVQELEIEQVENVQQQQTPAEQLPETQQVALETEKSNEALGEQPTLEQNEETKPHVQEETIKEIEKSQEKEVEKSGTLQAASMENPTNLVEPSLPLDSEVAETSLNAESRETISSRAPASPITAFNALYFRGAWATPFDGCQSSTFNVSPNKSVAVNMLSTVGSFRTGDIPELASTAIELPYNGSPNRYSLLVLLPQDTEGALNKLMSSLSTHTLRSLSRYMTQRLVHVQIPEFEIGYVSYPQTAFRQLGIKAAFDANLSEFPGISRSQRLFLQTDALAQLVRFRVDATSSSTNFLSTSSLGSNSGPAAEPPVPQLPSEVAESGAATRSGALQFRADRPFIFVLRDNVDKLTLVAGRIGDPASRPVPPLLP